MVGDDVLLRILTRDNGGQGVDLDDASMLQVVTESKHAPECAKGNVRRCGLGEYEGHVVAQAVGEYLVRVLLDGQELQGSPLKLQIHAGKLKLSHVQSRYGANA
jgi:hypothetical protein